MTSNELFPVERGMEVLIFYDEMKIAHVNLRDLGSYKTCTDKDYEVWTFHQKVRRIDNQRAEFIRKKANAKCYFRKELIIQNLRKQNFSLTNVIFFFLLVLVIAILLTLYRNKIISFIIKRTHVPIYSTVSSISVRSSSQSFNEDSCQSKIDINNSNIKHQ